MCVLTFIFRPIDSSFLCPLQLFTHPILDIVVDNKIQHAKRTVEFARIFFQKKAKLKLKERNIIPNDTKLFAQADIESSVDYYLSSDSESMKRARQINFDTQGDVYVWISSDK